MLVSSGTMKSSTLAILVVALMTFSPGCKLASADTVELSYYLHDNFVPPNITAVQVASANGNFTNNFVFGDTSVFDTPILAGIEENSTAVGWASGQLVAVSVPLTTFIVFTHDITTGDFKGTLSGSGRFNRTAPSWEVAVTGGTGSFRKAVGYFTVTVQSTGFIIRYDASLELPNELVMLE